MIKVCRVCTISKGHDVWSGKPFWLWLHQDSSIFFSALISMSHLSCLFLSFLSLGNLTNVQDGKERREPIMQGKKVGRRKKRHAKDKNRFWCQVRRFVEE